MNRLWGREQGAANPHPGSGPGLVLAAALAALLLAAMPVCGADGGYTVFVSQAGSASVAVIDPLKKKRVAVIPVGTLPHDLLPGADGKNLYVVLTGSQAIAEIDTRSRSLRRRFLTAPVPERRDDGTVIEEHRARDAFSHTSCFDCHNGGHEAAKPTIVGTRPFGIALSEDASRLYVSSLGPRKSFGAGSLVEIEAASGRTLRTLVQAATGKAYEPTEIARLGDVLYLGIRPAQPSMDASVIRRIGIAGFDLQQETVTGSDPTTLLADPERKRVLVSNFESNTVTAVDEQGASTKFTVEPGPLGQLLLPGGHQALVLNYYANSVSFVDLDSGKVSKVALEMGGRRFANPTKAALSPDGKKVFIVSAAPQEGNLLVLDLKRRRVSAAIPIDGLSFDVAVIPD